MAQEVQTDAVRRVIEAAVSVCTDLDLSSVLERVVAVAAQLSGARYAALAVLDADGDSVVDFIAAGLSDEERHAIGGLPKGLGVLRHAIEAGTEVRIDDVTAHPSSVGFPEHHPDMHALLAVPIHVRERIFGNLFLAEKHDGGAFTEADASLVTSFALTAGVAIEHARLFERTMHRERVIEAFNNVALMLMQGKARDDVLGALATSARSLVSAALASIVLPDGNGGMYVPAADGRLAEAYRGRPIPSTRLADRVAHVTRPGSVEDLSADPMVGRFIEDLGPTMYVPVNLDGAPYGCIVVIRVKGDVPFNDQDIDLLRQFARQAAVVLDYDRRREREAELVRAADHFRIAENLQDSALQEIFAASLRLSGAAAVADTEEVQARIGEAIEGLDRAIRLTRQAIFDLKSTGDSVS